MQENVRFWKRWRVDRWDYESLNVAESTMLELEKIFEKLCWVEEKLDKQEKYLNILDRKGDEVQEKVKSSFQKFMQDTRKSVKVPIDRF